ncbi:MAG: tyrosine-type recombinase/integrase [Actinomycetota bacterium]|nr:tyrosine-type recombinase/integrase [Actinomycetota bacterium]
MLPEAVSVPEAAPPLYEDFLAFLACRGVGNETMRNGARTFLARFPDPQAWAALPLAERLAARSQTRPFLNFLMLHGHLRPGYDYLLERKLAGILNEARLSPMGNDLERFFDATRALGYSERVARGMTSEVAARLRVEIAVPLGKTTSEDLARFEAAISARELRDDRSYKHYRTALFASHAVLFHLGAPVGEAQKRTAEPWSFERYFSGVDEEIARQLVAYCERIAATLSPSTTSGTASELAHFGRFLAGIDPDLHSLSGLDRRRHIEPYLSAVARAQNPRTGEAVVISTKRSRIQAVGRMLDAMTEWGWEEAPRRRLVFIRDSPRLPRPLPRYLPPDEDRRLVAALELSPNRLLADALLLMRASGVRIGELCDLELDCVHEVPGQGAWLKVPLGKLLTERMVPLDDDTVAIIDRIVAHRSPGRPLRHPRTGKPVEFLLTQKGRRVFSGTLRVELARAAESAGIGPVVPHQLRHTFATALVNAGCSLQSLMAMLGHVSAEMSLRYGRLFDETVRADYERALTLAKGRLGEVLPEATLVRLETDWHKAPLVKTRLAGGCCVRTLAQGACTYANICEHCPNFRSDATFLPALLAQRADTADLLADAEARGWGEEAARHRRLVERLDKVVADIEAEGA